MYAERYLEHVEGLLGKLRAQASEVAKAGAMVASAIEGGGVVHVFGTGHSHLIAEETFFRAGGLAGVSPVLDPDIMFNNGALHSTETERQSGVAARLAEDYDMREGDIGIVISNSGRNAAPVEMAIEMKQRGLPVIAITNLDHSKKSEPRNDAGKRLFEVADVVLDNAGVYGDAAIDVKGLQVGATSTVTGAALIQAVMIEAIAALPNPVVFPSANADDDADLTGPMTAYRERIRFYQ